MGNEKLYSLAKVRHVFNMILSHESQFIDFTIPRIFSDSPTEEAYEIVKSNFLTRIDWSKLEIRKNPDHEDIPLGKSRKSKKKEKERDSYFEKLEVVAQFILNLTAELNSSRTPSLGVNSVTWARLCKDLMQHGKIFNSSKLDSYVCRGLLFSEMLNAYKSLDLEKPLTEGEEPWIRIQINPKRPQKMLLEFLGQLCKTKQKKSAEVIHNFLHFGYLAAKQGKEGGIDTKNVALMLTPCLLDGLDFSGYIRGNNEEGGFTPEELFPFAQLVEMFLQHPIFSKPFNEKKYAKFNQPLEEYQAKLRESKETLWQTVIDKPSMGSHISVSADEPEKEKMGTTRVPLLKLFGMRFGSKRTVNPPTSPKTSPKSSPTKSSSKKGSRNLSPREMDIQAEEKLDAQYFTPNFEKKRRSIHLLGEGKNTKLFHTFQELSLHEKELERRKRGATLALPSSGYPTASEDECSVSSIAEPQDGENKDNSNLNRSSSPIPTRKKKGN
ncbi:MAG: hypothetical protein HYX61_00200 [Gammaproteobacteria bacterium]|jgi:hypothetical protein|nr:hypothetical protein [Gammaproteobacteria bacterium]